MARVKKDKSGRLGKPRGEYKPRKLKNNIPGEDIRFEESKSEPLKEEPKMEEIKKNIAEEKPEVKAEEGPGLGSSASADNLDEHEKFENWRDEYENVEPEKKPDPKKEEENTGEEKKLESGAEGEVKIEGVVKSEVPFNTNNLLFNGKMILMCCDILFPMMVKKILMWTGHKSARKLKTKDMILTEDQRTELMGAADDIAAFIFGKIPPELQFIMYMGSCYYINGKMSCEEDEEEPEKK